MTNPAGERGTNNRTMLLVLGAVAAVLALAIIASLIILTQSASGRPAASTASPSRPGPTTSSTPAPTGSSTPTPVATLAEPSPTPVATRTASPAPTSTVAPPVTPPPPTEGPLFTHLAIQPYAMCEDSTSDVPISIVWGSDQAVAAYIGIETDNAKLDPVVSDLPGSGLYLSLRFPCSLESQSYTVTLEDAEGHTTSGTGVVSRRLP